VRMMCRALRSLKEPFLIVLGLEEVSAGNLDGAQSIQFCVVGLVDRSERSAPRGRLKELILSQRLFFTRRLKVETLAAIWAGNRLCRPARHGNQVAAVWAPDA